MLRNAGIPVMGFTWLSLADRFDSQQAMPMEYTGVSPVGLFNLKREIRPVGLAYRDLIVENRDLTIIPVAARRREA
jgi:hypothetical protein